MKINKNGLEEPFYLKQKKINLNKELNSGNFDQRNGFKTWEFSA